MKWNESFSIGIAAMDDQHKKIFEHLLAIENAVAKRDPPNILRYFVTQMADYLKFHLAVEEAMLEVIRYPESEEHCGKHAKLLEQIDLLAEQLQRKPGTESIVGFFENWFVSHVLSEDRKYAIYVKKTFPALAGKQASK